MTWSPEKPGTDRRGGSVSKASRTPAGGKQIWKGLFPLNSWDSQGQGHSAQFRPFHPPPSGVQGDGAGSVLTTSLSVLSCCSSSPALPAARLLSSHKGQTGSWNLSSQRQHLLEFLFLFFWMFVRRKEGRNPVSKTQNSFKVACSGQTASLLLFICFGPTILSDSDIDRRLSCGGGSPGRSCCSNLEALQVVRLQWYKMPKAAGNPFELKLQVVFFPFLCLPYPVTSPTTIDTQYPPTRLFYCKWPNTGFE